jgi:hypothetical protein
MKRFKSCLLERAGEAVRSRVAGDGVAGDRDTTATAAAARGEHRRLRTAVAGTKRDGPIALFPRTGGHR